MKEMIIDGAVRRLKVGEPILYVDNEARKRSGHVGHALANFGDGKVIAFNMNTSPVRVDGHSEFGWMEYRISEDFGETFGEINELPYSKEAFFDGNFVATVEKAVVCDDGSLVAIAKRGTQFAAICSYPHLSSYVLRSTDQGKTWEEPYELAPDKGRVYDVIYHEGSIYALEHCNDAKKLWQGTLPEHVYKIFKSDDNGKSFYELCVVPFPDVYFRAYGALNFDLEGNLVVYAYNKNDEYNLDYIKSPDKGQTWGEAGKSPVPQRIRNPQIGILDDQYILHGREAGNVNHFMLYTSADGINWDNGVRIVDGELPGMSFYSDNVVIEKDGKNRMLIQYSQCYYKYCVNVYHRWLEHID